MSSEDDLDVFNDFVRNNKSKLKDKYVSKIETELLKEALDSFIVSDNESSEINSDLDNNYSDIENSQIFSSSENDSFTSYKSNKKKLTEKRIDDMVNETPISEIITKSDTGSFGSVNEKNDKLTKNEPILNISNHKKLNESSDIFSDDDDDFNDSNLTNSDNDIDISRNTISYKTDINLFKTPINTGSFESVNEKNDKLTNNEPILNISNHKKLNESSDIFSDDDDDDFNDSNLTNSDNDIDISRNTISYKTDINLFKTPINKKPDVDNILSVFKTPKIPTFKTPIISDKLKKSNNFQEKKIKNNFQNEIAKPLYKDELPNEKSVKKLETAEFVTPTKKKINLQSLIKTCAPKTKPITKKFNRLIVESDDDEEEDEEEEYSSCDDDFINDSDISADEIEPETELSDSIFSEDSLDSSDDDDDDEEDRKKFVTPKRTPIKQIPYTMPTKRVVEKLDFISSLLHDVDDCKRDPEAIMFRLKFKLKKEELAQKIYKIYNEKVFSKLLPENIDIIWNVTLRKTAGKCFCKRTRQMPPVHSIHIVLSKKVITDTDRLLKTLIHEMCHGASWMINKFNAKHGPVWKNWTVKAHLAFPTVPVSSRCHSYNINYKFHYVCQKCNATYKRHSKSIDTNTKVCGKCKGKLTLNRVASNGKMIVVKENENLNKFSIFVKENYKNYRKPGVTHAEAMKKVSELYKSLNKTPKDELSSLLESIQLTDKSKNQ